MKQVNIFITIVKFAWFVPVIALFYRYNYQSWYSTLFSSEYVGFFIGGLSMFVVGVWLKRHVIATYVEQSVGSLSLGILALTGSIAAYIYGSYVNYTPWAHYDSLLLIVFAYVVLSLDSRIIRSIWELILIMALSFFPVNIAGSSFTATAIVSVVIVIGIILLFLSFVRFNFKLLLAPVLSSIVALSGRFLAAGAYSYAGFIVYFVPFLFLVYLLPDIRRELTISATQQPDRQCVRHVRSQRYREFCSVCGKKLEEGRSRTRLGLSGLLIIGVVLAGLVFVAVPTMSLSGNFAKYSAYSYTGVVTQKLPSTPQGLVASSSTPLSLTGDLYAVRSVYYSGSQEGSLSNNYTLYYEIAQGAANLTSAWGPIHGWQTNTSDLQIGDIQGSLITYSANDSSILVFAGQSSALFLTGTNVQKLNVHLSIVREFQGIDPSVAQSQFVSDLQSYWAPLVGAQSFASVWDGFLYTSYQEALGLEDILLILISVSIVLYGAFRALRSDSLAERFLSIASRLPEKEWSIVSSLLNARKTGSKERAIASLFEGTSSVASESALLVSSFEKKGLIRGTIRDNGNEPLLTWRVSL
jgi:hypothetical protein